MNFSRYLSLISLPLIGLLFAAAIQADPVVGQPAPAFSGVTADGKIIDLAAFTGKPVVLEWTNHECPFVKKHYDSGNIPKLQQDAAAKDFIWLQIISSAPGKQGYVDGETAAKLNEERGATPSQIILDPNGTIGKLYGATNTPQFFIIDAEGLLVYKGGIDSIPSADPADIVRAKNHVSVAFSELAAGRKLSKPVTRPYGCTIKYES